MSTMTLEQLKAENTEEPEVKTELPPESEEAEVLEGAEDPEVESDEPGEADEKETSEEPVEAWMQTEGETSDSEQKKPSFAGLKRKLRAKHSAEIDEKEAEIARLRAKLEGAQPQSNSGQLPPRPTRADFDFDDDAYDAAIDVWNDKKLDLKLNQTFQRTQQQDEQTSQQQAIAQSVDEHWDKAAALVAEGKVTEDAYRSADNAVRQAIERALPKRGDATADILISHLNGAGEGSEKVWFHIGNNTTAQDKLETLLRKDPSGLSASIYLGDHRSKGTATTAKRVSQAPAPGSNVKGDATSASSATALQKKYGKLSQNDVQGRIDLKRAAKAEGIDTSTW